MDSVLGRSATEGRRPRDGQAADVALAVALAALLLPVSVRTLWSGSWLPALLGTVVVALVVAHAALAVRRSAPRLVLGVTGGLVVLLVVSPPVDLGSGRPGPFSALLVPSVLVFPVALYTVAAWCPSRTSLLALGLSVAGTGLVVVRLWGADYLTVAQPGVAGRDDPVRSWPLFVVLGVVTMVLLPWWAGRHRRLRLLYVAELEGRARREEAERAAEARRAVEEERRRIAREMHDVVAHSLSVMVSQAEGGRLMAGKDPAVTVPVLDTIARTGREAMHDMGCVLQVLDSRPAGDGSPEQPQPGLAEVPALVEQVRRSGVPVRLEEEGGRGRLSGAAELAVYRVTQEALTNVLKHAGPGAATDVTLTWRDGWLDLGVGNRVDPGHRSAGGSGLGLRGMDERVSAVGGSLRVTSAPDRFSVLARIPVATETEDGRS